MFNSPIDAFHHDVNTIQVMPTNPMMMATPESMPDSLVASTSHEPVGIQVSSPIQIQGRRATLQSAGSLAVDATRLGRLRSMSSCVPAMQPAGSSDTPPPRTLVLCFDGTGDQFDEDVRRCVFMLLDSADTSRCRTRTSCNSSPC